MISSPRLKYIDAMRGLAILLVVFSHVTNAYVKMPITNASFAGVYYMMTMFRMPLFFFVSGFFAYRAAERWDRATVGRVSFKKFKAQIVGLAVFCFLYGIIMRSGHFDFIRTSNPYWFTESLFEMFFIYLGVALLERKTGNTRLMPVLLAIAAIAPFLYNHATQGVRLPEWLAALQPWHTVNYFPYFMLGIFARKYEWQLWRIVDNQYFRGAVIAIFFSLVIFYGCNHRYSLQWDFVQTAMRLTGLMTVLVTFRAYRDSFEAGNRTGDALCFIGKRTLDIYYLHYFFIPDLSFMKGFLSTGPGNSVLMMLILGLTISAAVVALCLLVSAVLRSSTVLASWLFGAGTSEKRKACKIEANGLEEEAEACRV